jgi:uncharacterized protein YegP (UPF0339 family)
MALRKVYISVRPSVDGQFFIRMRSSNGKKLMASETYKRKATAVRIATALKDRQVVLEA